MKGRRAIKRVVFLALLSLTVGFGSFVVARLIEVKAQTQSNAAFTAFEITREFAPNGDDVHDEYMTVAFKADGSSAIAYRRESPGHVWMDIRVVRDLSAGKAITVDPFTDSLITYPLSARSVVFYHNRSRALTFLPMRTECTSAPANTPHSTILGYAVVQLQRTMGFPGAPGTQVQDEAWEAPELGCFPLEETHTLTNPDGLTHKFVRLALSVVPGSPSPALFEIPSNYAERPPSQVFAAFARRYPSSPAMSSASVGLLDSVYQNARKGK